MKKRDPFFLALIILGWVAIILLLGVGGEVALDDSWNFAGPTQRFLETGKLVFNPFNSAAAVLHVLWGSLVCRLAGFSLAHCTYANLLAALLALLAAYWMARRFGISELGAFLITAAIAASPPFFITAFTYQSDMIFLLIAWAALGAFLQFMAGQRDRYLAIASVLVALSLWNKIHGLLLAAAMVLFLLIHYRRLAVTWLRLVVAVGIPAISWFLFVVLTPIFHPVRTTLERKSAEFTARITDPAVVLGDGLLRGAILLLCLGAYAVPVLLAGRMKARSTTLDRKAGAVLASLAGLAVAAATLYLVFYRQELFPYAGSVLRKWPPLTNPAVLIPWTGFSVLGAFGLAYHLLAAWWEDRKTEGGSVAFVLLAAFLQMLLLVPILWFMDRYFLVFIPLVLMVVCRRLERKSLAADAQPAAGRRRWAVRYGFPALAILFLAAVFCIDSLRLLQYRNGVAAQWGAADQLVAEGNGPITIDGGYSWFGWRNYPYCLDLPAPSPKIDASNSPYVIELCPWAPIRFDVVFHEMPPPRRLIGERRYRDPLAPGGEGKLYLYERSE